MKTSSYTLAGINVINQKSDFEQYRFILEFVEGRLQAANLDVEFVDVEPHADGGIRFSLMVNGKEF